MNFIRSLFVENYWFVSQIFRIGVIFTYIATVILFGRFLLEIALAIEKIVKICRRTSKKIKESGDKHGARFV